MLLYFVVAFMRYYDNIGGSIPTWLINWAAKVTMSAVNYKHRHHKRYTIREFLLLHKILTKSCGFCFFILSKIFTNITC